MRYIFLISTLFFLNSTLYAQEAEKEILNKLLHDFLSDVNNPQMHNRFWSEDLVYTSSAGKRFGKSTVMDGFKNVDQASSKEQQTSYSAEEVQIRIMENVAVVAFKLIAKSDGEEIGNYFNSGVFQKKEGIWKVINWQATIAEE
ncbi:nuclear transport factor 2 family protein [Marivirga arenosa]|uniref:Nuclear transport factor 2 family protein n=1 Tax=Marivirga arenosa TaxID=3059076 RepID=A0AA52EWM3_9BACT|nr:nuclear transport factor 2 family protein [Marivirga sp. BKB1-2]WNB18020.1 nuclear transport factor 2 family protein [Marivirga sp. BKB1-2]